MVLVWYVIQVINGREDVVCERIEHVVPAGAIQELFLSPKVSNRD